MTTGITNDGVVYYRDPVSHEWTPLIAATTQAGAAGPPGPQAVSTDAGNALTLGSDDLVYLATGGVPHRIATGLADDDHAQYLTQAEGDARYAPLSEDAVVVTDWNSATENNVTYQGSGAANCPGGGGDWFVGHCISYSSLYKKQVAWQLPTALSGNVDSPVKTWERFLNNGTWESWRVQRAYMYSVGTGDNFLFMNHGATPSGLTKRLALGMGKDTASANPLSTDQFRVQTYNTSGTFTATPFLAEHRYGYIWAQRSWQSGYVSMTPVANEVVSEAVTFDTAFTVTPVVVVTAITTVPGDPSMGGSGLWVAPGNVSTTGFIAYGYRTTTGGNVSMQWLAVAP